MVVRVYEGLVYEMPRQDRRDSAGDGRIEQRIGNEGNRTPRQDFLEGRRTAADASDLTSVGTVKGMLASLVAFGDP